MASSRGMKVVLSAAVQENVAIVPLTGWEILPRTSDSLNRSVELLDSETIVDSRVKTPGAPISASAEGDIECEFIKGVYDKYIAAAAGNAWVVGSPAVGADTLTFGGDVVTMFAIDKQHKDAGIHHYWSGMRVNTFKLDIPQGGYAALTLGFMGQGYENASTMFAKTPLAVALAPKATSLNVTDIRIDNVTAKGTACATAFSFELTNNMERNDCLGSGLYGDGADELMADMTGSLTLKYGQRAQAILDKQLTAAPIRIEVDITFPNGTDKYTLTIPKAQTSGDLPSGGMTDLLSADLTYTVVADTPADAPTLTRTYTPIPAI